MCLLCISDSVRCWLGGIIWLVGLGVSMVCMLVGSLVLVVMIRWGWVLGLGMVLI